MKIQSFENMNANIKSTSSLKEILKIDLLRMMLVGILAEIKLKNVTECSNIMEL